MKLIVKNIYEWINLITRIKEIKKVYEHSIIEQTIFLLEQMQKNNLVSMGRKAMLLDILVEHGIDDISQLILFLNKLKNIYDLDTVLKRMEGAIDKYGINQIALILDQTYVKEVDTYYSNHGFRECYFPEGVIPKVKIDFRKSMNMTNVFADSEFIVDEQNFKLRKAQRIYYTSDFRFGSMSLPSKKEMDYASLDDFKKKWVDALICEVAKIPNDHVVLELEDPNNQKYSLFYQIDYCEAIQTDGEIKDVFGEEVTNFYYNGDIVVMGADVFMICGIENEEITQVKLIIHPSYFKKYVQQLENSQDKYLLNTIYQLLERKNGLYRV